MARAYPPTGSQPPSIELIVRQGPRPGQRFSLTQTTAIIGRTAGNDVVVNHPEVSRRHASLTWDGRQFIIQDLGSANGTFVNGVRLTAPQVLQPGDAIGLGPTVLLDFQAALPVVSPSDTLRARPAAPPPAHAPRPPARRRGRILIPLVVLLGLCVLLAVAAAAGYYFLWPRSEARPLVLIRSPRHGEQVEVGQEVTVHSIARDEGKVTRVELWVDGQLQEAQTSTLPGGSSPFPLLARWQPSSPGTHTLIARAFNARGGRGQAAVNVEAVVRADRDGDGVPDAEDACPDEAGLPESNGCPVSSEGDRDGDGILDEADTCPDEAGPPSADGCPDADGDGVRDSEDDCPDEPGLPEQAGCPTPGDRDDDGVPDAEDACPEEPGLPEQAGCPDRDGDGVRDGDDECPDEPGPEPSGCPDRDGDGVPDPDDLRPDEPGQPDAGGAPDTGAGDRDGDGIPDDVDLCPNEPGLPEHAGCPPPGPGGAGDSDGDGTSDDEPPGIGPFGEMGGDVRVLPVEFEALEFEVFDEYDEIYCYAGLAGEGMERYGPFEPLGARRWDIAAHLGGENSRTVPVHDDELLEVQVECGGVMGQGVIGIYWGLGSFIQNHPLSDWDGHVLTGDSSGGDEGHSFQAQYRICADSCEEAVFAPPLLLLTEIGPPFGGEPYMRVLTWRWGGDESMINGFRLYVNGSYHRAFRPDQRSWELPSDLEPSCGERLEFQVTAFEGPTLVPNRESPPSNILPLEGPPCPLVVRVIFNQLETYDLRNEDDDEGELGPIFGSFYAQGSTSESLSFDGSDYPDGYRLRPHTTYNIRDIFDWILGEMSMLCSPSVCPLYNAPEVNYVIVELGPDDDLTIGGAIYDSDRRIYQTVFNGFHRIPAGDIASRQIRVLDRQIELIANITVISGP